MSNERGFTKYDVDVAGPEIRWNKVADGVEKLNEVFGDRGIGLTASEASLAFSQFLTKQAMHATLATLERESQQ